MARPARRLADRPGERQQRPGSSHARPSRQPDDSGLGADDRRLGRGVHVPVLPDWHLAVVAVERQRRLGPEVEAAQYGQRQPSLYVGLLDPVPAGDAKLHRRLDQLPQAVRPVRIAARPNCQSGGGHACSSDRQSCVHGGSGRHGGQAVRNGKSGQHFLADRPEAGMEGRLRAERRHCGSGRRRRYPRRQAPHPAAARNARAHHAPLARRHGHGADLAGRHLPRRNHPGAAVDYRNHHLVAGAQAARAGGGLPASHGPTLIRRRAIPRHRRDQPRQGGSRPARSWSRRRGGACAPSSRRCG